MCGSIKTYLRRSAAEDAETDEPPADNMEGAESVEVDQDAIAQALNGASASNAWVVGRHVVPRWF